MAQVTRDLELKVPQGALFKAITEFENYPQFLPEVVSAKTLPGAKPEKTQVQFELEIVKKFQYSLEFSITGIEEVKWKLLESNFFKTNQGMWKIKALTPESTMVHYELEVDFGFLVPGWISKKLTEVSLPQMFSHFEKQAKKRV